MKIILCPQGEPARVVEICNELTEMQSIVGGYIEAVPVTRGVVMICNEEGKLLKECKPNRRVAFRCPDEIIYGDFFFCGEDEEDLTDVPKWSEQALLTIFRNPAFDKNGKKI